MAVLSIYKVDGVDFTDCVKSTGLGWEKNDIEEDDAGRDDNYDMHRAIGAKKRKLPVKCKDMTYAKAHAFALAHDKPTVEITYLDLIEGVVTKTFYGTKIAASAIYPLNGVDFVEGVNLELVEV